MGFADKRRFRDLPRIAPPVHPFPPALVEGVKGLLEELSRVDDAEQLIGVAGNELDTLLRPESCVVYLKTGGDYKPAFVRGRAVPPFFAGRWRDCTGRSSSSC